MLALRDSDAIRVVLEEAHVTNAVRCVASVWDFEQVAAPKSIAVNTDGMTPVRFVRARTPKVNRTVEYMSFFNDDTVNHTLLVSIMLTGVEHKLVKVTLGPYERLEYHSDRGSTVLNAAGAARTIATGTQNVASAGRSYALLASDVINNNAVANSIQDVTGLSFPVVAGQRYWFRFFIHYTSAATATGSRWSINGPAFSELRYRSEYTLSAAGRTVGEGYLAYNQPAVANTQSLGQANTAIIEGAVLPTVDGDVIARFASEVANSAITAKAGSFVEYLAL